jgi:hypothetical protein
MNHGVPMTTNPFKAPSAWLPIAMSGVALVVVLTRLWVAGTGRESDEGAAAHLWQLLMVGQAPLIGWFLYRSTWGNWRQVAAVLAVQGLAFLLAAAPVFISGL